jgi:hypothetical protein
MAAARVPATARLRNAHTVRAIRLSRRILSAIQTLIVRPQPHRRWRLLQKMRRARTVRRGPLSSKPVSTPCRMSVPTVRQCGHGVSLSRSTIAAHSASSRQNHRSSLTLGLRPPIVIERTEDQPGGRRGGVRWI